MSGRRLSVDSSQVAARRDAYLRALYRRSGARTLHEEHGMDLPNEVGYADEEEFIAAEALMEGTLMPVSPFPLPKKINGASSGEPARLARFDAESVLGSMVPVRFNWSITACASPPSTFRISEGMLNT